MADQRGLQTKEQAVAAKRLRNCLVSAGPELEGQVGNYCRQPESGCATRSRRYQAAQLSRGRQRSNRPPVCPANLCVRQGVLAIQGGIRTVRSLVVVGDPGAGKSTFTDKLCFDIASPGRHARAVAPLVVVLREFVADAPPETPEALLSYALLVLESRYGIDCDLPLLQRSLMLGRLVVVFDGLDELLGFVSARSDAAARRRLYNPLSRSIGGRRFPTARGTSIRLWTLSASTSCASGRLTCSRSSSTPHVGCDWSAAAADDAAQLTPEEVHAKVAGFMTESERIEDLRSNPLMLALLCRMYKGPGTLPRTRPAVYQRCARMLFETWDSERGIKAVLPIEQDLNRYPAPRLLDVF